LIVAIFDPIGVVLIITFNQLQKELKNKKEFTKSKIPIESTIDIPKENEKQLEDID